MQENGLVARNMWAIVESSWTPQSHPKFEITISKTSPLVVIISQSELRYYKGLQGEYNFKLFFKVIEKSSKKCIAESNRDPFYDISTAIELEKVQPGIYLIEVEV